MTPHNTEPEHDPVAPAIEPDPDAPGTYVDDPSGDVAEPNEPA